MTWRDLATLPWSNAPNPVTTTDQLVTAARAALPEPTAGTLLAQARTRMRAVAPLPRHGQRGSPGGLEWRE
ncbi:hypothetical protein [Streptomyces sp. PsTaAH-124]|uniref:hypothetical protein n=1 Tax=Streptomyces sp. PsTaAH-124 TaxID=1157638 RepID=UPI0003662171|nr:hypothetical protein [Streptomyces sp. PsTaAH-124]